MVVLLTYLDECGEQVSVSEVGRECRLKPSSGHGESGTHSPLACRYITSIAYGRVECGYKVGHDSVGIVQTSKDRDDIGAWVGVLLSKGGVEEDCQGLSGKRMRLLYTYGVAYLEGDVVGRGFGLLDAQNGLAEELLRVGLLV